MNGKLYIFGIGGTDSRVIKSLVMLAASGIKIGTSAIVPIIVDPDFVSTNVTRTIEQIKAYVTICSQLASSDATKNRFFEVPIESVVNDRRLALKDTKNKKFREFIEFSTMSKGNRALASMLFSEANLESDMEVGFKGNPNIGSVVLNQFTDSQDFTSFANAPKSGDRVFIISSVFGRMGASGFPLLLKDLRELNAKVSNNNVIQHIPIGTITVLSYFAVKTDEESIINSSTFIEKTKAVLQYYECNVNGGGSSVNVLYYIGDEGTKQYRNEEGRTEQRNNAHIVELAAAVSIVDFASIQNDDPILVCEENSNDKIYAPNPDFREFGIEKNVQEVLFNNLTQSTRDCLCTPITQFILFAKYVNEYLRGATSLQWARDSKFDDAFLRSSFINDVQKFVNSCVEWLEEISDNGRTFEPSKLSVGSSDLYSIVDGVKPGSIKALWASNKSEYDLFDTALNKEHPSLSKSPTLPCKFTELFYNVTKLLVGEKYKF